MPLGSLFTLFQLSENGDKPWPMALAYKFSQCCICQPLEYKAPILIRIEVPLKWYNCDDKQERWMCSALENIEDFGGVK